MKLNQAASQEEWQEQVSEQRRINKNNADYLNKIAEKVANEEPLTSMDRAYIVGALKKAGKDLLMWEPVREGNYEKVPEEALLLFYAYTNMKGFDADRKTRAAAIKQLSNTYNVSDDTVRKRLRALDADKKEGGARQMVDWFVVVGANQNNGIGS